MYCQRMNVTTGRQEWVVAGDDYEYSSEILRSQYGDMVQDIERVSAK